ncbi:6-bladed beta-propeller [Parabacteroides pacaensis]|uniref:6-bladed beta-propeller n=1 Tax=Parabacteroides pacaensis TaxID=2086575 RepID=UPI000D106936|nr:6-bladed beta-propeller [Parabacteroides pacaensis]
MRQILFMLISLFFLFSCKREKNQDVYSEDAKIVDINNPTSVAIEDFITDVDTIRLEVTDSSLLGDIHQIHIMNDKFYILDIKSNAVFIFARNGDFIKKISRVGQGPLEYIKINNMELDYKQKHIIFSDTFSRRIFICDEYGELVDVKNLSFIPNVILARNNNYLNFYAGYQKVYDSKEMENFNIHILDDNGKFISSLLENKTPLRIDVASTSCIDYDSQSEDLLFQPVFSNCIYKIDTNNVAHVEYVFRNKSEYKLLNPNEQKKMTYIYDIENTILEKEKEGYLLSWGSIFNLDDYCFFVMRGWNYPKYIYYEKATGRSVMIDPNKMTGNSALRQIFETTIRQTEGNYFYTSISSLLVDELVEKLPEGKLKTFFQNNNTVDSNPLIIKYKMKFPQ